MPPDGVPALPTLSGAVLQEISHRGAALPPGTEAGNSRIPNDLARLKRANFAEPDPLPIRHLAPLREVVANRP